MIANVYETELEGKTIGFKCGSYAIAIACREAKVASVQELFARMAQQDLLAILALFYGSACQYRNSKKQSADDISMDVVSGWIESIGEDKSQEATKVLLETLRPKNAQASPVEANQ